MSPKCIGIVGGAGPQAGAYLLERIFALCGQLYGCHHNADFPKVILISYPFSAMFLKSNAERVRQELSDCLAWLRSNGASVIGIACNTLHLFLEQKDLQSDLVHLPRTLAQEIDPSEKPIVFCTSTSAQGGLHRQFFPCCYPDKVTQKKVDFLIDDIMKGKERALVLKELNQLIQEQVAQTVILGCTELSLFFPQITIPKKRVIDLLEVLAHKILEQSFDRFSDKGDH